MMFVQSLFEVVSLYKSLFLGILCPSSPRPGPSFGVAEAKGARNSSRVPALEWRRRMNPPTGKEFGDLVPSIFIHFHLQRAMDSMDWIKVHYTS
jgi:hypothetical protein